MSITLGALTLPDDLIWIDEFTWTPMAKSSIYSIDGKPIIQNALKLGGRPITLSGDVSAAWIARGVVKDLWELLSSDTNLLLTLNDARTFNVTFAPGDNPINAQPIVDYSTPDDADWYSLSIKLIQV